MEQKMAEGTGLSLRQEQFLAVVFQEASILNNFYLSGGTALSSWYLHHRESYDLDFFSNRPFDGERIASLIRRHEDTLQYRAVVVNDDFGFYTFMFRYPDNSRFKVDFAHYTSFQLKKGFIWKGLAIDSLYDIAVNKIHTIRTHPRERDYIDLYVLLKKTKWDINELLRDANKKFEMIVDPFQTAKHALKAFEITSYPKMLVPFNKKTMVDFYEQLARSLQPKIFK